MKQHKELTLQNYFAANALAAIGKLRDSDGNLDPELIAEYAFEIADKMVLLAEK